MHEYEINVNWKNTPNAVMKDDKLPEIEVNAPANFGGPDDVWSPEHLFVSSIASCTMLSFMYFAEQRKVEIKSYESQAKGTLKKGENGFEFESVIVNAKVEVPEEQAGKVRKLAELGEKYCLVSNSVKCNVEFNVTV
jgi:peroxiredoxin-like protein